MICFECEQEVIDRHFMVGVDRPYVNLFFHRECKPDLNEIKDYLTENYDKLLKFVEEFHIITKNKRNRL